jgi:uncharacterized protein (DUF2345 family)
VAANGIALYAQGSDAGSRPVKETGIKLHAASGQVSVQAQQDKAAFAASKAVTLASVQGNINTSAKQHVLLTAAGAYLKIQGGDIEIGAPGKAEFKGAQREMAGPQSSDTPAVALAKADPLAFYDEQFVLHDEITGHSMPLEPYRIVDSKGALLAHGWTDAEGQTARVRSNAPKGIRLLHGFETNEGDA